MTIGDRIKFVRLQKEYTLEDLARTAGVGRATIHKYENGLITNIPLDRLEKIAKALCCSPAYLMGWEDDEPIPPRVADTECREYPVIGEVAAGYGSIANEEETGDYEYIPLEWLRGHNPNDFFVLRVKGNSMYPDFKDNDRVLVHRQTSVDSGSIAVVIYDSEVATLKKVRYKKGEDWLELIPINPEYMTKRVEGEDLENCIVLGQARKLVRTVK